MAEKKVYDYSADIIRAIAIILVVTVHISTSFVDYPPYFKGFSWWIANFVNSASRVAVPLFVMLSAYLLLTKSSGDTSMTISPRMSSSFHSFCLFCFSISPDFSRL